MPPERSILHLLGAIMLSEPPTKTGFIAAHELWNDEQKAAAKDVLASVAANNLRMIRVTLCDPQGKSRGKILTPDAFQSAMASGLDFVTAQYNFDSAEAVVYNPFSADGSLGMTEMAGFPNVNLVPDPLTFRILPWAPATGWILGDMYFRDGRPMPFDARHKLKAALAALQQDGFRFLSGLEVEFYVTKVVDQNFGATHMGGMGTPPTPPSVESLGRGYSYMSEINQDYVSELLDLLAGHCAALRLPLRTMEDEMGPGQLEFTFEPQIGLATADSMVLFRSMVKQVATRMGLHATFMTRPGLPNFFASGWHLHQSLLTPDGENAFASKPRSEALLADTGRHFVGGLLEHAVEASVFTTPTINGYKRRKPYSLAPDRATWGYDNRAAMIRVQGAPGETSSHIENRIGEPAANPYLYLASQVVSGLDGLRRNIDPGPLEASPYEATDRPLLPRNLMEAIAALEASVFFRKAFGDTFINWLIGVKKFEANRFLAAEPNWHADPDAVTNWEHCEYFTRY
jgi:glutamine synthetase